MVRVVAFIYIVSTIAYLALGDNTILWGGFNHLNLLLSLAAFMKLPKPTQSIDKDFVNYALGITLARAGYTVLCVFAERSWVYEKTDIFTIAVIASFVCFLIYSAATHKKL